MRLGARVAGAAVAAAAFVGAAGGCSGSGHQASPPTTTATTAASTTTTTVAAGIQASGQRTVLSPIGLNLRAGPSLSAKVLGTAAQGTVLQVLGHSAQSGGWYLVHGATVRGWITDSPRLSAPGTFSSFTSTGHNFSVLYPTGWTVVDSLPHTRFRSPTAGEQILVRTSATVGALVQGRTGYYQSDSQQVVLCGITSVLFTYTGEASQPRPGTTKYLAQVRITLDAHHALGVEGDMTSLSQLDTIRDFLYSISFPYPQCEGK